MKNDDTIKSKDWRTLGFSPFMGREISMPNPNDYISGSSFDIMLDEMLFNRMIQFKNLSQTPQGNEKGKTYFDPVTKKLYIWTDKVGKWAEVIYTTTSTSTTSSSTSTTTT